MDGKKLASKPAFDAEGSMFTIIFNDLSKISVDKSQLLDRQSQVHFDATDGEDRSALSEYIGTGIVDSPPDRHWRHLQGDHHPFHP